MTTLAALILAATLPYQRLRVPQAIVRPREEIEHPKPENDRKRKGWEA